MEPQNRTDLIGLTQEALEIERLIFSGDDFESDVDPQLVEYLEGIQEKIISKVDAYKYVMDKLVATEKMLQRQRIQIEAAERRVNDVVAMMNERVKQALLIRGETEVQGSQWRFVLKRTRPSLIVNEEILSKHAPQFMLTKTVNIPDKERIREALSGENKTDVPGCELRESYSLTSYVNQGDQK